MAIAPTADRCHLLHGSRIDYALLRCPRYRLVPRTAHWTRIDRLGHANHDSYRQHKRTVTGV
jgi:hypothetical protein